MCLRSVGDKDIDEVSGRVLDVHQDGHPSECSFGE